MAAAVKEMEKPMQDQQRIARLEANVAHIQTDVTEIKADVRKINDKIDMEVRKLNDKLDAFKDALSDLKIEMERRFAKLDVSRALDKVWYLLILGGLLVVIARAFKWI
jgi:hypothetical protein